jgi:hypothetical protein
MRGIAGAQLISRRRQITWNARPTWAGAPDWLGENVAPLAYRQRLISLEINCAIGRRGP